MDVLEYTPNQIHSAMTGIPHFLPKNELSLIFYALEII
jgi:hypothetical protein